MELSFPCVKKSGCGESKKFITAVFCINNETHVYTLSRRFVVYENNCFFLPAAPCGSFRIKALLF